MKSSDALDAEIKSQSADPAPEATSPEPAAPPQDPNLITFGLRRYDFLQMQEEIADHALEAYRPFLPGLWIGSAPGGQARIRSATGGDGQRGLMLGTVPGNLRKTQLLEHRFDSTGRRRAEFDKFEAVSIFISVSW